MATEARGPEAKISEASADLRFPIGKFKRPETVSAEDRERFIAEIEAAPANLRAAVEGLADEKLNTPYRPGGWTVRQVIHHVPESHMNAYIRFKLALTENQPAIKPYAEDLWANLAELVRAPVEA